MNRVISAIFRPQHGQQGGAAGFEDDDRRNEGRGRQQRSVSDMGAGAQLPQGTSAAMSSVPGSGGLPSYGRHNSSLSDFDGLSQSSNDTSDALSQHTAPEATPSRGRAASAVPRTTPLAHTLDQAARQAVSGLSSLLGMHVSSSRQGGRGSSAGRERRRVARAALQQEARHLYRLQGLRRHRFSALKLLMYTLRLSLRSGAAAWTVKAAVGFMLALVKRRGFRSAFRSVVALDNLRFGGFVAALVAIATGVKYALRVLRQRADWVNAAVGGAVAGTAMLLDSPHRRTGIALFVAVRAGYALVHTAMRQQWLQRRDSAVFWVFAVANAPLTYAAILEPYLLEPGYRGWMFGMGGIDKCVMDSMVREAYWGISADTLPALYSLAAAVGSKHTGQHADAASALAGSAAGTGAVAGALTVYGVGSGLGRRSASACGVPAQGWVGGVMGPPGTLPPAARNARPAATSALYDGLALHKLPWFLRAPLKYLLDTPTTATSLALAHRRAVATSLLTPLAQQQRHRAAVTGGLDRSREQGAALVRYPAADTPRHVRAAVAERLYRTDALVDCVGDSDAAGQVALSQLGRTPPSLLAAAAAQPHLYSGPAHQAAYRAVRCHKPAAAGAPARRGPSASSQSTSLLRAGRVPVVDVDAAVRHGQCGCGGDDRSTSSLRQALHAVMGQRSGRRGSTKLEKGDGLPTTDAAVPILPLPLPPELLSVAPADLFPGVRVGPPVFKPCRHAWHGGRSCLVAHVADLPRAFAAACRMYAPIHMVPLVLFRAGTLWKAPLTSLRKAVRAVYQSAAFLTVYVFCVRAGACLARHIVGPHLAWWQFAGIAPFAALGLAFESPKRNSELTLYTLMRGLDVVWQLLEREGWVARLAHGEVALFAASMALLLALPRSDFKSTYRSVLNFMFGTHKDARSLVAELPPGAERVHDTPTLLALAAPPAAELSALHLPSAAMH